MLLNCFAVTSTLRMLVSYIKQQALREGRVFPQNVASQLHPVSSVTQPGVERTAAWRWCRLFSVTSGWRSKQQSWSPTLCGEVLTAASTFAVGLGVHRTPLSREPVRTCVRLALRAGPSPVPEVTWLVTAWSTCVLLEGSCTLTWCTRQLREGRPPPAALGRIRKRSQFLCGSFTGFLKRGGPAEPSRGNRVTTAHGAQRCGTPSDGCHSVPVCIPGNHILPDEDLASFHWSLLGPEHPLASLKVRIRFTSSTRNHQLLVLLLP